MLNKIVVLIFVGAISAASTVAQASDERAPNNSNKSLIISNSNSSYSIEKQTESAETKDTLSQGSNIDNTIWSGTGWLLGVALFGFVMLSNRSRI